MILGLSHHHDGDDLVITSGWPAMVEGFGFSSDGEAPLRIKDAKSRFLQRITELRGAHTVLVSERARQNKLEQEKATVRIAAETDARQRGLNISETDKVGKEASDKVIDEGPLDPTEYLASQIHEDDHSVDGILIEIRKISDLRWEHSAPTRIGCRMGRPEKAAPRVMNPRTHTLFPIELNGGNQRLLANAMEKESINVQMGKRTCTKCGKISPMVICHHRIPNQDGQEEAGLTCGGRTLMAVSKDKKKRRRGEVQNVNLTTLIEDARIKLGLDRIPRQIKCMKKIASRDQTPEAIEKGILRAQFDLPVFRDGTIRYDMSDVPITHFTPREVSVSWKTLKKLGYTHDCHGNELLDDEQMLEIFPQDFIVAKNAGDYFVKAAKFIDEVLTRHYKMEPFYNVETPNDLVGQLICALAPHTSGGVLSRIIGWTDCSGGYAHPLFHAAKRRNCDGDEDAIMLLMDGLLNFSREILPANRGGLMDAPLVLTTRLNPTEVDKEALNVDSGWFYERDFYEATLNQPHPKTISDRIDFVERRLGTVAAVRGYGYTHGCNSMDEGPALCAYKTLDTMIDKMNGQLDLGHKLRAVNVRTVASSVVRSHFLPDLRGNMNAFARQKVRCLKCAHSYRRLPVAGKCIQKRKVTGRGLSAVGVMKSEGDQCGGKLALTVSEGAVRKYIKVTKHVMATYGVDSYTKQNVEWLSDSTDSLFKNDRAKQMSLADFL
jgi:DNA polymerase II large subunit